jgi:peptide-methionine (S)-S-oxide reductase
VKKILIIFLLFQTTSYSQNLVKVYFAGGCFWCMEESFEKTKGILEAISGYSGGITENPTYKEVTYGNTGHFETVKIIYDSEIISYRKILEVYWKNIDPFDSVGQFCDKGYSYRSVVFYSDTEQKKIIKQSIKDIELKFNKNVVTYTRKFDKFYEAESYHQDYYQENFVNYLMYKNSCGRERELKKIWN